MSRSSGCCTSAESSGVDGWELKSVKSVIKVTKMTLQYKQAKIPVSDENYQATLKAVVLGLSVAEYKTI